jgi:inorganic triphosphatase YgiF
MKTEHLEIETKLVILSDAPEAIANDIARLESLGGHQLRRAESVTVRDLYFDTPDLQLESRGLALRMRSIGSRLLLALKGPEVSIGSTMQREELEQDWSREALASIQAELSARGVGLVSSDTQLAGSDPVSVLKGMGLIQMQDRQTTRRRRQIVRGIVDDESEAELAIDRVMFRFGDRRVCHYEVEIELEASNDVTMIESLIRSLRARWPVLTVWHHSKYAMGRALEVLLEHPDTAQEVGDGGDLSPTVYEQVQLWLQQRS